MLGTASTSSFLILDDVHDPYISEVLPPKKVHVLVGAVETAFEPSRPFLKISELPLAAVFERDRPNLFVSPQIQLAAVR